MPIIENIKWEKIRFFVIRLWPVHSALNACSVYSPEALEMQNKSCFPVSFKEEKKAVLGDRQMKSVKGKINS